MTVRVDATSTKQFINHIHTVQCLKPVSICKRKEIPIFTKARASGSTEKSTRTASSSISTHECRGRGGRSSWSLNGSFNLRKNRSENDSEPFQGPASEERSRDPCATVHSSALHTSQGDRKQTRVLRQMNGCTAELFALRGGRPVARCNTRELRGYQGKGTEAIPDTRAGQIPRKSRRMGSGGAARGGEQESVWQR